MKYSNKVLDMKNRLLKIVLSGIMTLSLFGCGKSADKIANQYTVNNSGAELYADIPLTYTDGFSSKIAVVGADAVNSPGSDEITSDAALLVDVNTGDGSAADEAGEGSGRIERRYGSDPVRACNRIA